MKKIAFLFITVFTFIGITSFEAKTENPNSEINWVSIEEAYKLSKANPKKVIIDVYTGWCGWCKVMDKKTFTNPEVIKFVNENYYAVKLDAESRQDITIGDKTYTYNEQNRANEAAVALLQGKMSYPSIVYLDEQFNMIQPIPGYMEARQFHEVITFLGKDHYKKESFEDFKSKTYPVQYKEALAGL
jgi:thioredoxin-related protein